MTALNQLTLTQAREGLAQGEFTAVELTESYLSAMEQGRDLNAYVLETADKARAMAQASDARIASGDAGPLEGLPLGVKDMFCTEGGGDHRLLEHPEGLRAAVRIHRHQPALAGRRGDAGQAQQ